MNGDSTMVSVRNLCLSFPNFALNDISFEVARGDYFVILGPTGSGKTLLIESLCGLHQPRSGSVHIDGQDVTHLDPSARSIAYVPQDYALLPFKTVRANIAFGLEARRLPKAEITARTEEMLEMLCIAHLAERYPTRLSGGERQRVALGRALAIRPQVLLLDEPFSAIDEGMREELAREILRLHRQLGTTTIHICHNLEEAMYLSDRLAIFNRGQLVQHDVPEAVLAQPASLFVARFLRLPNQVPGEVRMESGVAAFYHDDIRLCATSLPPGPAVAVLPTERLTVMRDKSASDADSAVIPACVLAGLPKAYRPEIKLGGSLALTVPGIYPARDWPAGSTVYVRVPRAAIHVLPQE